ncbi:MAG TPA: bestrophin family ion channel [Flavisolibacter sp.]|jgi:putative membrane protein|nr:bestrophin family ion channel [Flavisolibacter sp.]
MISYNPKKWVRFIFNFHKADTVRKMFPLLVGMAVYSFGVAYVETEVLQLSVNSYLKNVSILHTLLGFAISMLLVFRTNTAYDRWWEGRRQWGALVNSSRNLAVKLSSFLPPTDPQRTLFAQLIPTFALELKNHLQSEETSWQLDERPHPEIPNFNRNGHVPNQVVVNMMAQVQTLHKNKILSGELLLFINPEITSFLDICGACERIKNTPIPYSYSVFIKKFIFLYVLSLPIGLVFSLGYLVIPVVVFVFYVLGSLELIAEEIEEPFGKDANDLPMQRICDNIRRNVAEILA